MSTSDQEQEQEQGNESTVIIPDAIHINFITGARSAAIDEEIIDDLKYAVRRFFELATENASVDYDDYTNALIRLKLLSVDTMSEKELRQSMDALGNESFSLVSAKIMRNVAAVECKVRCHGPEYPVWLLLLQEGDRFLLARCPQTTEIRDSALIQFIPDLVDIG